MGYQLQLLYIYQSEHYLLSKNGNAIIIRIGNRHISNVWDGFDFKYSVDTLFRMRVNLYALYKKTTSIPLYVFEICFIFNRTK